MSIKTIIDLKQYTTTGETSLYKGIPIQYLDISLKILRIHNIKYKIRYRGPRNNPLDTRHRFNKQSNCLKQFAKSFTVYTI